MAGLPLFIVMGREVHDNPNSEAEDVESSSGELVEYLINLRGWEKTDEVNKQIHLVEEALAANYLRGTLRPRWGR